MVVWSDPLFTLQRGKEAWQPSVRKDCRDSYTIGEGRVALVGQSGPPISGAIDRPGHTTLAEAAAMIREAVCYIGIDSGLMWIAGSLQVPTIGLYGTSYIPACEAHYPLNPYALYLQAQGDLDQIEVDTVLARLRDVLAQTRRSAE